MYPPLSRKKGTYIRRLTQKKHRLEQAAFVVEGGKSLQALIRASRYVIRCVVGTLSFFREHSHMVQELKGKVEIFTAGEEQLAQLGFWVTNREVITVVTMPTVTTPTVPTQGITLALDGISDPGNLGTIIRIADWYGIETILCTKTTVELYNPKVLQATMGSFTRVHLYYVDLPAYLTGLDFPKIGAMLTGCTLHDFTFPDHGILVIGNESSGVSGMVTPLLTHRVTIPRYGHAPSLNAAVATAVVVDHWRGGK